VSARNKVNDSGAEQGESCEDENEIASKSVVTTPGFLSTFNAIWGILQNSMESTVPKSTTISLETVVLEGDKDIYTFNNETPPTMCQRCCDKVVAIENLMKAVRHQFWEIKMLLEESSRKSNEGNVEEPVEDTFAEDDSDSKDDIQVKEEEEETNLSLENLEEDLCKHIFNY